MGQIRDNVVIMKFFNVLGLMVLVAGLGVALCTKLIPVHVFGVISVGMMFVLCLCVPENPEYKTFENFGDSIKA